MSTKEVWKPIPGYEGYYEVSDRGQVKSFHRSTAGILMSLGVTKYDQRVVTLCKDGVREGSSVTALVARAFIGEPEDPEYVAVHINRDPADDRPSNIKWGPLPGRGPARP